MACLVLTLASASSAATADSGHVARPGTSTTATTLGGEQERDLPRTALEADERDNGHTAQTPYLIWSGLFAVVLVGGGGLWMQRRQAREDSQR